MLILTAAPPEQRSVKYIGYATVISSATAATCMTLAVMFLRPVGAPASFQLLQNSNIEVETGDVETSEGPEQPLLGRSSELSDAQASPVTAAGTVRSTLSSEAFMTPQASLSFSSSMSRELSQANGCNGAASEVANAGSDPALPQQARSLCIAHTQRVLP